MTQGALYIESSNILGSTGFVECESIKFLESLQESESEATASVKREKLKSDHRMWFTSQETELCYKLISFYIKLPINVHIN